MTDILVPTAPGELVDKLTILRIKSERISDVTKLVNVLHEMTTLQNTADQHLPGSPQLTTLWDELYQINLQLWVIEDDIRDCERAADFGPTFIALARAVYVTNDERARVKKAINQHLGSAIVEEKSYAEYRRPGA